MPVIAAGICCLVFLWVFTGSSCFIRSVFGIPCPGCGSTRAVAALCRGKLKEALYFHPLIFVSLGIIAAHMFKFFFKIEIRGKSNKRVFDIFLFCLLLLYLGVYISRMILFYPNSEPMTYLGSSMLGRLIGFVKGFF